MVFVDGQLREHVDEEGEVHEKEDQGMQIIFINFEPESLRSLLHVYLTLPLVLIGPMHISLVLQHFALPPSPHGDFQ